VVNKNLYVIGDIHGELEKLKVMLKFIQGRVDKPSVVCFLGDYVDRGPDSYGVVELLSNLENTDLIEYKFLMGNHEDMLLSYEVDKEHAALEYWALSKNAGGTQTIASYVRANQYPMPAKHIQFYLGLDPFYKHPIGDDIIVCVHAGIDPALPLSEQTNGTFLWERDFVGYKGKHFNPKYFVVHGHTPANCVIHRQHQLGIDTGAVFEGPLTCAEFIYDPENNETNYNIWQTGWTTDGFRSYLTVKEEEEFNVESLVS
jgi:serine/threonine protein phosphatase 1